MEKNGEKWRKYRPLLMYGKIDRGPKPEKV